MMKAGSLLIGIFIVALLPTASALHVEANEFSVNSGSGDGFGNNVESIVHATYAIADIGASYGDGSSIQNYGTVTTNGGSVEALVESRSNTGQHASSGARIMDGFGTLNFNQASVAAEGRAEAGQISDILLNGGYGETVSFGDDSNYNSVGASSYVQGLGAIQTEQNSYAGYGNLFANQASYGSVESGDWVRASSDAWTSSGIENRATLEISNSGEFLTTQSASITTGDSPSTFAGQISEACQGQYGGSISAYTGSGLYWYTGGAYPGVASLNANVQNGYIRTSMYSGLDSYSAQAYGSVDDMAGEYGWMSLNSYASNSGANSNKATEFWNGYANSGLTAGTDGWNAWTAWELPVDWLPCV